MAVSKATTADQMKKLMNSISERHEVELPTKQVVEKESKLTGDQEMSPYSGTKILLPEKMSEVEGIVWLARAHMANEAEVQVNHQIPCIPFDGAIALTNVLKEKFGFVNLVATPSFFGPRPPVMVSVEVGPGNYIQVPWGRMEIATLSGYLETGAGFADGRPVFFIRGMIKRRDEARVLEIANAVREELLNNSIYRAKAIRINLSEFDPEEDDPFDTKFAPKFMTTQPATVILNEGVEERLRDELYTVVTHTEHCRKFNIPVKRGVLLHGPYGTGKTLTATNLAHTCVNNGWTFIYVESPKNLITALQFAALYQPAVVFIEDIDRTITEYGDADMTEVRNALDSVITKGVEIAIVMTTNHVEKLPHGFLRCGRVDSAVHIDLPDATAMMRLVKFYGGDQIEDTDENIKEAVAPLAGQAASAVREIISRAGMYAISRYPTDNIPKKITLTAVDLEKAVTSYRDHAGLLVQKRQPPVHPAVIHTDYMLRMLQEAARGRSIPTNAVVDDFVNSNATAALTGRN